MPAVNTDHKALVDTHMLSLHEFLTRHIENVRQLQDSCRSTAPIAVQEAQPITNNGKKGVVGLQYLIDP